MAGSEGSTREFRGIVALGLAMIVVLSMPTGAIATVAGGSASTASHVSSSTAASAPRAASTASCTAISGTTVIDTPGCYRLTTDVVDSGAAAVIEIRASDVVLDGGGHVVDGVDKDTLDCGVNATDYDNASCGVFVNGTVGGIANVTVRNLSVRDWAYGVYLHNATGSAVTNVSARSNGVGIFVQNTTNSTVRHVRVREIDTVHKTTEPFVIPKAEGVSLRWSDWNTIEFVDVIGSPTGWEFDTAGLALHTASHNTFRNISVTNASFGLLIDPSHENQFTHTKAANSGTGISLSNSDNNQFSDLLVTENSGNGISMSTSDGNAFSDCEVSHNGFKGLKAFLATGGLISHCSFEANGEDGVHLGFSSGWSIEDVTSSNNGVIGFAFLESASSNVLSDFRAENNAGPGVFTDSATDLTIRNGEVVMGPSAPGVLLWGTTDTVLDGLTIEGTVSEGNPATPLTILESDGVTVTGTTVDRTVNPDNPVLTDSADRAVDFIPPVNGSVVQILSSADITLRGDVITGVRTHGIHVNNSTRVTLDELDIDLDETSNGSAAISFSWTHESRINHSDVAVAGRGDGIILRRSEGNVIRASRISSQAMGIYLERAETTRLERNTIIDNQPRIGSWYGSFWQDGTSTDDYTLVSIVNGGSNQQVTLSFHDGDGTMVASTSSTIAPGAQWRVESETQGGLAGTANNDGYLQITSSGTLSDLQPFSTVVIPNNGDLPGFPANWDLKSLGGIPVDRFLSGPFAPNRFHTAGSPAPGVSTLAATQTNDTDVIVESPNASFVPVPIHHDADAENGSLVAPIVRDGAVVDQFTFVAVTNLAPAAQNVTARFRYPNGTAARVANRTLGPGEQWIFTSASGPRNPLNGTGNFTGYLVLEARNTSKLLAQADQVYPNGSLAGVTGSSTEAASVGAGPAEAFVRDGSARGEHTALTIVNTAAATQNVSVRFAGANGTTVATVNRTLAAAEQWRLATASGAVNPVAGTGNVTGYVAVDGENASDLAVHVSLRYPNRSMTGLPLSVGQAADPEGPIMGTPVLDGGASPGEHTLVAIRNTDTVAQNVTLRFHDFEGQPVATVNRSIAPTEQAVIVTASGGPPGLAGTENLTGYFTIEAPSADALAVQAHLLYDGGNISGLPVAYRELHSDETFTTPTPAYGVYLNGSNGTVMASNRFDHNFVHFASVNRSTNSTTVGATLDGDALNFSYAGDIGIRAADQPPAVPTNLTAPASPLNITNASAAWVNLTFQYPDDADVNESTLAVYRYNGTAWTRVESSAVDPSGNRVTANLTRFGLVVPLATPLTTVGLNLTANVTTVPAGSPVEITVRRTDTGALTDATISVGGEVFPVGTDGTAVFRPTAVGTFELSAEKPPDNGTPFANTSLTFTVEEPPIICAGCGRPTDPDGDGEFEDTNGNDRFDFDDIVTFFEGLSDSAVVDRAVLYDFNHNGRIDFDDIVELFEQV